MTETVQNSHVYAESPVPAPGACMPQPQPCFAPLRRLNLVVVGKSGVGKSSFLNYAAGRDVFRTGTGDPVTEGYFDSVDVRSPQNGVMYSLYDTKGLESGNAEEWERAIFDEIDRRDRLDDMYSWFHTIIYCISAGDHRIEDFEVSAIRRLMSCGSVLVLLTKRDQVSADGLAELRRQLLRELGSQVQVLSVCNGARTRLGETPPSGLEDVLRASFLGFWEKIARTLPATAMRKAVGEEFSGVFKPHLSGLLSLMALTGMSHNIFPGVIGAGRMLGMSPKSASRELPEKKYVTKSDFMLVAENTGASIEVEDSGMALVRFMMYPERIADFPETLAVSELKRKYYRKAILDWLRRWDAQTDAMLRNIESGHAGRRFLEAVGVSVSECLSFYNEITGSNRCLLSQHKTEEMLDGLRQTVTEGEFRKTLRLYGDYLTSYVESCGKGLMGRTVCRRNAEYAYERLYAQAQKVSGTVNEALDLVVDTFVTELRAYGQYCLRDDEVHASENTRTLRQMVRAAYAGGKVISDQTLAVLSDYAGSHGIPSSRLDNILAEERPQ